VLVPSPQRYRSEGRRRGVRPDVLDNAVEAVRRIRATDARLAPVLTLRHLSQLTGIPYGFLRRSVGRKAALGYKFVYLKKRIPGRRAVRMICIPTRSLMDLQQWLVANILRFTTPHPASFAFHPDSSTVRAAEEHCGCQWLLKIDLEDFFHSISEGQVAEVFTRLGYQRLLAFELARLVTIPVERPKPAPNPALRWVRIPCYQYPHEGFLPQGAPTSPMLSNLVMFDTDVRLAALAEAHGMRYTRYADDLAFSCVDDRGSAKLQVFKRQVFAELNAAGFRPNLRKTVVRGPGARRVVLGLLVDTDQVRLPKEAKDNLRLHLHYLTSPDHGPAAHAKARQTSVSSLYHHVRGLISWAESAEPEYGARVLKAFKAVDWPPVQPRFIEAESW
jgi:RNA-directed DNA polymerase